MGVLDVWRFCPRCREELELSEGRAQCPWCGFVVYANSAPTANAVVTDEHGRVLLARRAVEPDKGLWDIPGGFLEEGEHPVDAIRRELREETSLEVEPVAFLCATIDRYGDGPGAATTLNLTWTARVVAGTPQPADDVDELRWFVPDQLPAPEQMAFSNTAEVLTAWREQQA